MPSSSLVGRRGSLLAALLALACTSNSPPLVESSAALESNAALESTAAPARCSAVNMRACFDDPILVAGTGQIARKGESGWRSELEGAAAVEVELSRPHFAMADDAGNIYIADKDAHGIRRVAPDGTLSSLAGDYASPNGLWVRGDGTVYVLDLGHARVVRVDPSAVLTPLFEITTGLSIGRGLWVADDERLAYVASGTRVLRWTPDEGVSVFATGFASLGNLIVDPQGQLVVTDRAAGRVIRIDAQGSKTTIAGNGGDHDGGDGAAALDTSLPGVRAIWFDAEGGYFLGTHESSRVWYVDADATIHAFLDHATLSEVRGLSLDRRGDLIIVDDDRGFVRVLHRRPS